MYLSDPVVLRLIQISDRVISLEWSKSVTDCSPKNCLVWDRLSSFDIFNLHKWDRLSSLHLSTCAIRLKSLNLSKCWTNYGLITCHNVRADFCSYICLYVGPVMVMQPVRIRGQMLFLDMSNCETDCSHNNYQSVETIMALLQKTKTDVAYTKIRGELSFLEG